MTAPAASKQLTIAEDDPDGFPLLASGNLHFRGTGFDDASNSFVGGVHSQSGPPAEASLIAPTTARLLAINGDFVVLDRLSIDEVDDLGEVNLGGVVGSGSYQNVTYAGGYQAIGGAPRIGRFCSVSSLCGPTRRIENVLGTNGLERILAFKKLARGWDCGRGEPLSVASLSSLEILLAANEQLSDAHPSVFLTTLGNVQIEWSDSRGRAYEIECFANRYEYYFESLGTEGSVSSEEFSRLTSMIQEAEAGA